MAHYCNEPSHTFSEYLLIPGYTSEECVPNNVSLRTPLVKYRKGVEEPVIALNIPLTSAIMQSVSDDTMGIALAREGGLSFIYGSQSIETEAEMVYKVKNHKAGFVVSASNLTPDSTLADVLALKEKNGFSTVAITHDGTANGKLLGIVSSRSCWTAISVCWWAQASTPGTTRRESPPCWPPVRTCCASTPPRATPAGRRRPCNGSVRPMATR